MLQPLPLRLDVAGGVRPHPRDLPNRNLFVIVAPHEGQGASLHCGEVAAAGGTWSLSRSRALQLMQIRGRAVPVCLRMGAVMRVSVPVFMVAILSQ